MLITQLIAYLRKRFVKEYTKTEPDVQKVNKVMITCQQCIERLLSIPEGSLKIFSSDGIDDYVSGHLRSRITA